MEDPGIQSIMDITTSHIITVRCNSTHENINHINMKLQKQLILPCGAKLKNRIAKSAMSENMSPKNHRPNESIIHIYQRWANGGAGLIITGNIMVDKRAIAEPGNILVEDKSDLDLLKKWARVVSNTEAHLWAQINHLEDKL